MGSLSISQWIIAAAVIYGAVRLFSRQGEKVMLCSACGEKGFPSRQTKGSVLIEIILWLCFIVPGLIYSIWRASTRYDACARCGSTTLIPVDSPIAATIATSSETRVKCPHCAELILREAKVCKHCGRDV